MGIEPSHKSIIVRRQMKFYGQKPTPRWTYLKKSISPGDTVLEIIIPDSTTLNWTIGKRIIIGSSSTNYEEYEFGEIQEDILNLMLFFVEKLVLHQKKVHQLKLE